MIIGKALLSFILLVFSVVLHATAQTPDTIYIDKKEYLLNTNPLTPYLKDIDWEIPEQAAIWSSNWRGYLAQWSIVDSKLILDDVSIELQWEHPEDERVRKSILKDLFPGKGMINATWYTGTLIIPTGDIDTYVHMGYGSTYESYKVLLIKSGVVTKNLNMSKDEFNKFKKEKFSAFKKTQMFKKEFRNLIEGDTQWTEEFALDFMRSFYAEHYLSL
ncbi:hypothetical protein [Kangiella taiwanensis]|uniref:Uncharacterized protein n=1 Tax=Kangiella taiwanensis TaxID=1079179 RepID=A0ABP8I7L3_9GAMM|nr:hypothetical protein [Kangiella taiwanensis]